MYKFAKRCIFNKGHRIGTGIYLNSCANCPWIRLECESTGIFCCTHPNTVEDERILNHRNLAIVPSICPLIQPGNVII